MVKHFFYWIVLACYLSMVSVSKAKDTLGPGEGLDLTSGDFLQSSNKRYQLSRDGDYSFVIKYVYMNHSLTVWDPDKYSKPSNVLEYAVMSKDGVFFVYQKGQQTAFMVNAEQLEMISNTSATLLDNGNLVLRAEKRGIVWQSFDYPRATWMPGMKVGMFMELNIDRRNAQKSLVYSPQQTLTLDPNNTKQLVATNSSWTTYWHSGTWNNGFPFLNSVQMIMAAHGIDFTFSYFGNENESYFTWNSSDPFAQIMLVDSSKISISSGDFSVNQTIVDCESNSENLSMGCACGGREGIYIERNDASIIWDMEFDSINLTLDISYCQRKCTANCSCTAYANISSTLCRFSGSNQIFVGSNSKGQPLFLRNDIAWNRVELALAPGPATMQAFDPLTRRGSRKWIKVLPGPIAALLVLLGLVLLFCCLQSRDGCLRVVRVFQRLNDTGDEDSLVFSFESIQIATNNFSDENKLGQGGYGPVYKGKFPNGQEIAVKRLQSVSGYGIEQFKNEVKVISNLQHRNLVRLLGYCTDSDERLLVYEFLPNNSLDSILFDPEKRNALDWRSRLCIIDGISQGLLYLHKYSRLKIIHRDLKTSNILLDNDLNPKISDFGTAKIFGDNESRANTNRIVGTYGYMSPEYAMDGIFSVKSDVFSFGVMMLEMICGKKNTAFYDSDRHINLLGYVWDLWASRRFSEIADPNLVETISIDEVVRYVQVGLLCVQENAADRPTMSSVVSMLNNELMSLPNPKQPSFTAITTSNIAKLGENLEPCSLNELTISELEGR